MDKRRCLKGEGMMTKSNVVEIISALVAIIGVYVLINAPEMGSKATSESVAEQSYGYKYVFSFITRIRKFLYNSRRDLFIYGVAQFNFDHFNSSI